MDSPQHVPPRTPLWTEVLWLLAVVLWWTAVAVGGLVWLFAELMAL